MSLERGCQSLWLVERFNTVELPLSCTLGNFPQIDAETTANVAGNRPVEVDDDIAKVKQEDLTEEDEEVGDEDEVEEDEEEEETQDFEKVSVWQKALFPVGAASLALMAVFILRRQMRD